MNNIKVIAVLGLVALTYFLGDTFFHRNSLLYENGRHFNEATLTVYNEQAIAVYFLLFIAAFLVTVFVGYTFMKEKGTT